MKSQNSISNLSSDTKTAQPLRVLMSGGGTGGHIFPAIAIAQEIKKRLPDTEFLFIGAQDKMEMEKVPQAGFKIEGVNIAGFNRSQKLKNILLPYKLLVSLLKVKKIIKNFQPSFAIGTGGFASAPALYVASHSKVKTFVQEQNSLPGKTNQFLAKKAFAVFTAYPEMEKFFPKTATFFFGNPVRSSFTENLWDTKRAKETLGLDPNKLTILSVGGSLGSRTLNFAWESHLEDILKNNFQLIWQTGKSDFETIKKELSPRSEISFSLNEKKDIMVKEFITDMALHYSAADVIVSRAGAIALSELALTGKALLLVPFPFAAEDHQTQNAWSLVKENAAKMVKDVEMSEKFWPTLMELCTNDVFRSELGNNLKKFAKPQATQDIVDEILKLVEN